MAINQSLDLFKIPLSALKQSTLVTLSASLNQPKIIPASNGLPRDWRGFAQLMGLNVMETNQISAKSDHFFALIEYWGKKGNVSLLQTYLATIDRYDVLDDVEEALVKDSLEYNERVKKINVSLTNHSSDADKRILTVDDVVRLEKGLEPQIYDAYILYAEEDVDFATEIIETMENKYNMKLCSRDRDLIGGVVFEYDAIAKLIAERCRRLVVIVSSSFLKTKANKFLLTFAQSLGIDIRERKVIPILYEKCEVPPELSYYFLLDYSRGGKLCNFWDKLRDSIQYTVISQSIANVPGESLTDKVNNDLWISRTRFEVEQKESELKQSEISISEKKEKVGNIRKIIKCSFSKAKRNLNNQEKSEKVADVSSEISSNNEFGLSSNEDVPIGDVEDSSRLESRYGNASENENNKKSRKKWYKKNVKKKAVKAFPF